MTREKAQRLSRDWTNRQCHHPNLEDEYHLGKASGNKVCTVCGNYIYMTVTPKEQLNSGLTLSGEKNL
ncbi:MAG TPA: hypothetical protein VF868_13485 [Bacteroidia bacterium]|jgi:transcription elongation factor Elf1